MQVFYATHCKVLPALTFKSIQTARTCWDRAATASWCFAFLRSCPFTDKIASPM